MQHRQSQFPETLKEKKTWFDILLYYLFNVKLSLRLTLIFQFLFILLFALASIGIGIHLFYLTPNVSFTVYDYGESPDCISKLGTDEYCQITIPIKNKLEPPINIYYQLQNFISNSKDYITSKSNAQLYGKTIELNSKESKKCHPYITNKQMGVTKSWNGTLLNPDAIASPCGLQAKLYFQDQFEFRNSSYQFQFSYPQSTRQFTRQNDSQSLQWIDPTDSKFEIWMTTSINKTVSKLYAVVNETIYIGNYTFRVKNRMNYTMFETKKNIKVMKINNEFGNNVLLGLLFVGGGTCLFVISLLRFVYDIMNLKKGI